MKFKVDNFTNMIFKEENKTIELNGESIETITSLIPTSEELAKIQNALEKTQRIVKEKIQSQETVKHE